MATSLSMDSTVDGLARNTSLFATACTAVYRSHWLSRGGIKQRMAATIRHNRARGVHGVVPMMDVVATLIREGWSDTDICAELGMSADEVLRFKQNKGLPELFSDADFSMAWE